MKYPFNNGADVIHNLKQHGYEAYFVGGCVRDLLLDRPIGDLDIATDATPDVVQHIFKKVIPVGIEHGTVIVRHKGESFEVTTYRVEEGYSDQRHPDSVQFVTSIEEDLKRRDFTINALAMDTDGHIIDPFNGQRDIKNRRIRTVGDGLERFQEDALRIIRGIRFASQLGFMIESNTLQHMITLKKDINHLAVERILTEMEKLISGKWVDNGLFYCTQTGIADEMPVFKNYPGLFNELKGLAEPLETFSEFIAFNHYKCSDVSISEWVKEWKASNRTKQTANTLAEALFYFNSHGVDHWLLYQLPSFCLEGFVRLNHVLQEEHVTIQHLKAVRASLPITSKRELAVDGNDLLHMFPDFQPGPWLKEKLACLEKKVVTGFLENDTFTLKEWLKCHPPGRN